MYCNIICIKLYLFTLFLLCFLQSDITDIACEGNVYDSLSDPDINSFVFNCHKSKMFYK